MAARAMNRRLKRRRGTILGSWKLVNRPMRVGRASSGSWRIVIEQVSCKLGVVERH